MLGEVPESIYVDIISAATGGYLVLGFDATVYMKDTAY